MKKPHVFQLSYGIKVFIEASYFNNKHTGEMFFFFLATSEAATGGVPSEKVFVRKSVMKNFENFTEK